MFAIGKFYEAPISHEQVAKVRALGFTNKIAKTQIYYQTPLVKVYAETKGFGDWGLSKTTSSPYRLVINKAGGQYFLPKSERDLETEILITSNMEDDILQTMMVQRFTLEVPTITRTVRHESPTHEIRLARPGGVLI